MGIFDFNYSDPKEAAYLALASGLLSGKGNLGSILGRSLMGANQTYLDTQKAKTQNDLQTLQLQGLQGQMERQKKQEALDDQFRSQIPSPQAESALQMMQTNQPMQVDPRAQLMHQALLAKQMSPMDYMKLTQKDNTPIKLSAGESLLDPRSYKQVATNPKDEKTADQKDYAAAVAQGYRGTLIDYQREMANLKAPKTTVNVAPGGVPHQVLKQQDELIDKMTTAQAIDADLSGIESRIQAGKLKFSPFNNLTAEVRNQLGVSSEESRNFATFKSTLEKLRNDSLRLNAGVQTEGDAQRAWNELFQNINDQALVSQRLDEIRKINQRGAKLHEFRLGVLRSNFGANPLPAAPVTPAIEASPGQFSDPEKEKRYQQWKSQQGK